MSFHETNQSAAVVEVEFRTTNSADPLTDLSARTGCNIVLEQSMPGREAGYSAYYRITGESPDTIAELLQTYEGVDGQLITADAEIGLFEVRIHDGDRYFAPLLTEAGALLSQMWTVDGESHLVVHVPATTASADVIQHVVENHPTVEVVTRRQKTYSGPGVPPEFVRAAVLTDLTDRQREVLATAYSNGYFEFPRRATGEDIAADLGISLPTFSEHLRAAERKILTRLFE